MDKVKRDRSANFSPSERDILVFLVQKYKTVLENKKSDARTWKMKEAAWKSIHKEFNARSGCIFRSVKTLRIKYEGMKRTVRKKSAARRSELDQTGNYQNTHPLDEAEEKIKAMLASSTDGFESIDYDMLTTNQESPGTNGLDGICDYDTLPTKQESRGTDGLESICDLHTSPTHQENPAKVSSKSRFNELIQAKLELVQFKKILLEEEFAEKKMMWEFERNERIKEAAFKEKEREFKEREWEFIENERKKEAAFKEKEWKWKEEEYKLKLQNFK
ncbi:hypothetical protein PYW07_010685 [Mythimna separata]|uniref:Regulatory protein zeste n=1 Tax=Mythimna separata TaxID=271217 RepID=A0AAD7Y7T3_MYTSE|nr:hypothetical protein PYW07_010685 [Mythimna separata]